MQPETIYRDLTPLFRDVLDEDSLVLTPQLTAAEVPQWDSFNHINLIVAIEGHFGVTFHAAELESLQSVGELAQLVESKLAAQGR